MNGDFAGALQRQREARRRRMMWRGGRIDQDRQDQDLLVEEGNYRPKNTSGDPRTGDPEEMGEENYAEGGEVKGKRRSVTEVTEANKDDVADEHHAKHMKGVRQSTGLEEHRAHGGRVGCYADGGEVPPVHEEHREHFGAYPEEDDHGDVMIMARKLRKRHQRVY